MKQLAISYCLALLLGCYLLLAPGQVIAQVLHGTFSGSHQHSLSIHADGSLWATGDNTYGQLGTGSTTSTTTWVQVGAATNWVQVAAGSTHSLGLRADGSLYAWGSNQYGQLGTTTNAGTTVVNSTPTRVGTDTYTQIAAGNYHCLGLRADGSLYAWGQNNVGQLGNATNTGTTAPNPTPTRVGTDTYTQVAAGALYYSMALKADGSLYAWGDNYYGQLGTTVNSGTRAPTPLPTRVGTDTYTQVVAGSSHCLALKADGSLYAWGDNYYGQLGNTTNFFSYTPNPTPTRVGTATYTQVAAGFEFTLGLRADGSLYAWGINGAGQLGSTINVGMGKANPTPLQVGTATNWVQVAAGHGHSLGLRADGSLYTWGYNSAGQLGNGYTNPLSTSTPTATSTALPTRSTAAGFNFGLAVKADGTLWAWGNNSYGQLGNGGTTASLSPRQIGTDHDWVQVAAGAYHSLALKADGTLWAWGLNLQGQLGFASTSGTYTSTSSPTQVGTGLYTQVAAGHSYSLGLRADGSLYA
jgi:alpha-tubulin suppressor-like RCC1 family protein